MQQPNENSPVEELGQPLLPPSVEPKSSLHQHQQNPMPYDQFDDDLVMAIALSLGDHETTRNHPRISNSHHPSLLRLLVCLKMKF